MSIGGKITEELPSMDLDQTKRVKILATVGPATSSKLKLEEMMRAGTDGFRLNFSHGTHAEKSRAIQAIREVSQKVGKPVAIVQDLHGPKIALSKFEELGIELQEDSIWSLQFGAKLNKQKKILPIEFDLSKNTMIGQPVFIADGRMKAEITEVDPISATIKIKIIHGGIVTSGKGLNLPETDFTGMVVTQKDIEDVKFGADKGFDYVALSFVQTADDVHYFRNLLKSFNSKALIISKIETKKAVQNLEEITLASDGVMVARGDLAVEVGPESVPVLQRKIIGLCIEHNRFAIVATQMLASMVNSPEPTRAEVSDVATAVVIGADCLMLSEETAIGNFPIEAIVTMKKTILYTQTHNNIRVSFKTKRHHETIAEAIADTVIALSNIVSAKAIVAETSTGASAMHIASNRPERTVIAITPDPLTAQRLALIYGIKSFIRPAEKTASAKLTSWLNKGGILSSGDIIVTASGNYPGKVGGTDTIKVRVI